MSQRDRDIFLYILPIAVGLASYVWEQKYGALLWIPGLTLGITCFVVIGHKFKTYYHMRKPAISAYADESTIPHSFRPLAVLRSLQPDDRLTLVLRTSKRWLANDDKDERKVIHDEILKALRRGAYVTFVLQDLRGQFDLLSLEDRRKLEKEQKQAIEGYRSLSKKLDNNKITSSKLTLRFRNQVVTDSMVVLFCNGKFKRLVQPVSMGFDDTGIVVVQDQKLVKGLTDNLDQTVQSFVSAEKYFLDCGREKIEKFATDCGHHLAIRNNSPQNLVNYAAARFLAVTAKREGPPPPLSVQLSLTNTCTHKKPSEMTQPDNKSSEMAQGEIIRTIEWIAKLKTTNILLSGEEPLAYLPPILDKIKEIKKEHPGLGLGILSSGVGEKNQPIDQPLARELADTCQWIQISVDSFDASRYETMRNRPLTVVLETIKLLQEARLQLEVCYTIQKENVDEIISGAVFDAIESLFPSGIEVRFKFAHGYAKGYLVTEEKLKHAVKRVSIHFKSAYLEQMMRNEVFTYEGVSKGLPIEANLNKFQNDGCKCQTIGATLFIDSKADVYPCCYLFDDNVRNSGYRMKYLLGSLKDQLSRIVPDPKLNGPNPIRKILLKNRLKELQKKTLPVEQHACGKCTRHVHQNEFLNILSKFFQENETLDIHLAENVYDPEALRDANVWI